MQLHDDHIDVIMCFRWGIFDSIVYSWGFLNQLHKKSPEMLSHLEEIQIYCTHTALLGIHFVTKQLSRHMFRSPVSKKDVTGS